MTQPLSDLGTSHYPITPLRVLMVLPSDFDQPEEIGHGKTYETTVIFTHDDKIKKTLDKKIPRFLTYSHYDLNTESLQANSWVHSQHDTKVKFELNFFGLSGPLVLLFGE